MPTPIEQALTSLLPTINVISPELTSLANSILIQSRSKAPQLKAEEEIGRIYACADIACDRYVLSLQYSTLSLFLKKSCLFFSVPFVDYYYLAYILSVPRAHYTLIITRYMD